MCVEEEQIFGIYLVAKMCKKVEKELVKRRQAGNCMQIACGQLWMAFGEN